VREQKNKKISRKSIKKSEKIIEQMIQENFPELKEMSFQIAR
jgi:hypothetical protein